MSEVYAAEHTRTGARVALKLLRTADEDQALLASTSAVRHRNVVQVFETGRDAASGCSYLVMERVEGEDLAVRLQRLTRLPEAVARRLFAEIADGIHAAHEHGIVHRDLKPANIMLSGDTPKLVDFGIAKVLGNESGLATGRRIGTPAYMAPEQLTGGLIARCVDVWAFGVILFEAITGQLPFHGFADGRSPQLFEVAPRAGTLVAISPELEQLIARCLERDPGKRPRSMLELAAELRGELVIDDRITQDAGPVIPPVMLPQLLAPAAVARPRTSRGWIAGALVGIAGIAAVSLVSLCGEGSQHATTPVAKVELPVIVVTPDAAVPDPVLVPDAAVAEAPGDARIETPALRAELRVQVRSVPAGARVLINGKSYGVTPAQLVLPGPASIVIKHAGYRSSRVRAERAGPIDVRLVRLPRTNVQDIHKHETLD